VTDMSGTTRRPISFLGIEHPADLAVQARTSRQADSINNDWAARYRDILAAIRG
jgi:hypothetical protein